MSRTPNSANFNLNFGQSHADHPRTVNIEVQAKDTELQDVQKMTKADLEGDGTLVLSYCEITKRVKMVVHSAIVTNV